MTQVTLLKKMSKDLSSVQREIARMRSFILGFIAKDKEGKYQPKFIQEITKAAGEKPVYKFEDTKSFLTQIKTKKN